MTCVLELRNVAKRYPAVGDAVAPSVLTDVNLRVEAGQSVAIVGVSGCGKSTLLNLMGALDRPSSGQVLLEGRDLSALSDADLAAVRRERIGFVFQLHHLLPQLTVLENVLLPTLAGSSTPSQTALLRQQQATQGRRLEGGKLGIDNRKPSVEFAKEWLARVGLSEQVHHRPGQISGGQAQRAALVRALVNRPAILLADEPTGALDHASAAALGDLLMKLNREDGLTLVIVTHSQELAARCGRAMHLADGTLQEGGA